MELIQAVRDYQRELQSLGRAANTIRARLTYLGKLCELADDTDGLNAEVMSLLFGRIPGEAARAQAWFSVRGFMAWAVRSGHVTQQAADAALGSRSHSWPERAPKHFIPVDKFPAALDIAGARHPIERAWMALALYTLCRESEINDMRLGGVDLLAGEIRVWRPKPRRWHVAPIGLELDDELAMWLPVYASHTGYGTDYRRMMTEHPDWHLVPRRLFTRLRSAGQVTGMAVTGVNPAAGFGTRVESIVKGVLGGLGVASTNGWSVAYKGEGAHTIRRSGARALWLLLCSDPSVGGQRALVQASKMLGHTSLRVTEQYIGADLERDAIHARARTVGLYGARPVITGGNVIPLRRSAAGA